ncbi:MAG TPA: sialidase family protein [Terriglobales bacterium]|nr:sialidase family protein [Terriglobales bacterium]
MSDAFCRQNATMAGLGIRPCRPSSLGFAHQLSRRGILSISLCCWILSVNAVAESHKILEKTLFKASKENYRYSEAAVLNLDSRRHLLLVVSTFTNGGHDDSPARLLAWESADGGVTFHPFSPFVFQDNIGKKNVMSPSFLRLSRNEVLFFFLITNSSTDAGMWVRRSMDNGKTWGPAMRLPYDGYGGTANDHVIRLRSGRILVPYWVSRDELKSTYSFCFYSDDRGQTWKKSNEITVQRLSIGRKTSPAAEEPAIIELKNGDVLMLLRTYVGTLYESVSHDGGVTWREPVSSGIPSPGAMPTLARIPQTGDILLLYNYAEPNEVHGPLPRTRMASAISRDEGSSFTSVRVLDGSKDFPGKMTMANVTFLGDDAVLFYSKTPDQKNFYSWMEQIIPIAWFYEGSSKKTFRSPAIPRSMATEK